MTSVLEESQRTLLDGSGGWWEASLREMERECNLKLEASQQKLEATKRSLDTLQGQLKNKDRQLHVLQEERKGYDSQLSVVRKGMEAWKEEAEIKDRQLARLDAIGADHTTLPPIPNRQGTNGDENETVVVRGVHDLIIVEGSRSPSGQEARQLARHAVMEAARPSDVPSDGNWSQADDPSRVRDLERTLDRERKLRACFEFEVCSLVDRLKASVTAQAEAHRTALEEVDVLKLALLGERKRGAVRVGLAAKAALAKATANKVASPTLKWSWEELLERVGGPSPTETPLVVVGKLDPDPAPGHASPPPPPPRRGARPRAQAAG